jgi:hypothetical protein
MSVGELVLKDSLRCIPLLVVFAGLAMVTAGCSSDSRLAANNSDESAGERTGYGTRSGGYSTDIYTELKGSFERAPRPQTQAAASGPVQPGQPAPPAAAGGRQVATSAPAAAPAPAGPPPENASPTAYGISSDGPTTDVATWLFGPKNH